MADFTDQMTIARNPYFQNRVSLALQDAAVNVVAEDPGTANHAARVAYAEKVIAGQANIQQCAEAVMSNSTIAAEATLTPQNSTDPGGFGIPDSDIQFAINSLFNAFAGVST